MQAFEDYQTGRLAAPIPGQRERMDKVGPPQHAAAEPLARRQRRRHALRRSRGGGSGTARTCSMLLIVCGRGGCGAIDHYCSAHCIAAPFDKNHSLEITLLLFTSRDWSTARTGQVTRPPPRMLCTLCSPRISASESV